MRIVDTLKRAISLSLSTWQESVLMALFIIPALWGIFHLLSNDLVLDVLANPEALESGAFDALGHGLSVAYGVLVVASWAWSCFATVIFFNAFDNKGREEAVELGMGRIVALSGAVMLVAVARGAALTVVTVAAMIPLMCVVFLGSWFAPIGYILLYVPIIYASLGLWLGEIHVYRGHGWGSLMDSWHAIDGSRWPMLGVLLIWYVVSLVLYGGVFGGVLWMLFQPQLGVAAGAADVGPAAMVAGAVVVGLATAFYFSVMRSIEYSVFEQLTRSDSRRSPLSRRDGRDGLHQPAAAIGPASHPVRTAPAPMAGPISVDTEVVNLLGLTKPVTEIEYDRETEIAWILEKLAAAGFGDDEVAAYLDGHWFPKVATGGQDWETVSDDSIKELSSFVTRDPETVRAAVQKRLDELGSGSPPAT